MGGMKKVDVRLLARSPGRRGEEEGGDSRVAVVSPQPAGLLSAVIYPTADLSQA